MSRKIAINTLNDLQIDKITTDLEIIQEPSKYAFNAKPTSFPLYDHDDDYIYVPFAYNINLPRPERDVLPRTEVLFTGELREPQKQVKTEAIQHLNTTGSVIIACPPAFGKTCLGINIATQIKLKTLIICHRVILINQWKDSIKKFCKNPKIQILTGKSVIEDADFYIINAINIPKHQRSFYKNIGLVIVDEAHIIMAKKISECMKYLIPRYIIALSATPYRTDGLDILLDMYFGKNKIIRKLFRKHLVYKVNTGYKVETKTNRTGKIDWGSVIESQSDNATRNEFIINIVKGFPERTFLILCKRINQANYLVERFKEEKEDVTSLIGKNQTFEQKSRILIGIGAKVGVGFDHPLLDSLILASDVEQYFVQYLGRVFRKQETVPVIFDLVDSHFILNKHFKTRESIYIEHGGRIKDFFNEFPNFSPPFNKQ